MTSFTVRHRSRPDPRSMTCLAIRNLYIQKRQYANAIFRLDNQMRSLIRRYMGWDMTLPEKERAAINKRAADAIAEYRRTKQAVLSVFPDATVAEGAFQFIDRMLQAQEPLEAELAATEKQMVRLAKTLPVASWVEAQRGIGFVNFANIVGEAGDLSLYSNPSKLWKRMGVGVIDGVRQGNAGKDATAETWIVHGYNAKRRSTLFVVGDGFIKAGGPWRALYDTRKELEKAKLPEGKPVILHRRAKRYVEKRFLRDLWNVWHGREIPVDEGSVV